MANQKIKNELFDSYFRARKIAVGDDVRKYSNDEKIYLAKTGKYDIEKLFYFNGRDLAEIQYDGYRYGWIDKNGNPFPKDGTKFKEVYDFKDGLAAVKYDNGKYGWIDTQGNPFPKDGKTFYGVKRFEDGLAIVQYIDNNFTIKWGWIDKEGNPFPKDGRTFNYIKLTSSGSEKIFENGFAQVQYSDDRWGWIDTQGNPFPKDGRRFSAVSPFKNGFAQVRLSNGVWRKIDKNGNYYDANDNPIKFN